MMRRDLVGLYLGVVTTIVTTKVFSSFAQAKPSCPDHPSCKDDGGSGAIAVRHLAPVGKGQDTDDAAG